MLISIILITIVGMYFKIKVINYSKIWINLRLCGLTGGNFNENLEKLCPLYRLISDAI